MLISPCRCSQGLHPTFFDILFLLGYNNTMSNKDKLIKEIDILREKRKDWFNVLFALSSAVIVLVYAVVSGEKPIFVLILGIMGFVAVVSLALHYKKIETDLENKLDELGKED